MKIRKGFVSNSSSSSFVIGVKGNKELTKDVIVDQLGVPSNSPLYKFTDKLASYLIENTEVVDEKYILDNYYYNSIADAISDEIQSAQLLQNGYTVREGSASYNEGENVYEWFIGNGGFPDINTDDFVFKMMR